MLSVNVAHRFEGFEFDVAFEAQPGITAIFGPSGSGKTSVIRAIAGLLSCDRAQVGLGGQDLSHLPPNKRGIGYVFQDTRLFPHLTVLQNLRYGGTSDEEKVIEVLGLQAMLERRPASLSGGEAQRVALGRALMSGPKVLLMDEPLSALDGPRKAEVMPYLEALRNQTDLPILYVSHDVSEVARLARDIVVMDKGRVVVSGPLEDVLSDPASVPFLGVRDAGAVLTGRVVGLAEDGLTKIETGAGPLWIPGAVGQAGDSLRVRIPAQDVILARSAPEDISALNVLPVTIASLERGQGPGVAVALSAGNARLLARITKRSCDGLGLRVGDQVFAILKATAIAPNDVSPDNIV